MSEQIAVRLPDELLASLDELVTGGRFESRAGAVRAAIEELLDRERRHRVGEEIAAGYLRIPQTDEEVAVATAAAIRSIEEEPW
jgi:Arc/MetJ-type ribon-helix-helix transcriptional regulator